MDSLKKYWQNINKRVLITALSATVIITGTVLAIMYAKGQRPTTTGVRETGLLNVNSFPTGAQVYINGKLTSATDDTLYLDPGEYDVEIRKDGYITWKKKLKLEKELVTQTNALLFPAAPSLSPLTVTGAQNLSPAPDGQKLVFYTASASAEAKNGLYLMDLTDTQLSLQRGSRQISSDTDRLDLSQANITWSPDSSEIIVSDETTSISLDIAKNNDFDTLSDITFQKSRIFSTWEEEMYLKERQILAKFPDEIIKMATESAANVYFSPDQEKVMYTAIKDTQLPDKITPPLLASNSQPQERSLKKGSVYIYDRKEDKNFRVSQMQIPDEAELPGLKKLLALDVLGEPLSLEASPTAFRQLQATTSAETNRNFRVYHSGLFSGDLQWYPDSKHLIRLTDKTINILQYDGTNEVTVYVGPFESRFVYPWSNGDKLLITTSFNQQSGGEKNLYAIGIK